VPGFLHASYRITDPERTRRFYETLGMELRRELPLAHDGEVETHYFFAFPEQPEALQLVFNHDGRSYDLGSGYGHIAVDVADLGGTLAALKEQGIEPDRPPFQPREGSPFICFVRDPDGYTVELFGRG
jgi:lactoylglutathione lyase